MNDADSDKGSKARIARIETPKEKVLQVERRVLHWYQRPKET